MELFWKSLIILILLVLNPLLFFAQPVNTNHQIFWKNNQQIYVDSLNSFKRLHFQDAIYHQKSHLPFFLSKIMLDNQIISDYKLIPNSIETISDEDLVDVQDVNLIQNDFLLEVSYSIIRKKKMAYVEILPLRRNAETGKIERLTDFDLSLNMQAVNNIKQKQNRYVENSKLKEGNWYKFRVADGGIYEISYNRILDLGFDNPAEVGVFGYGHMIPKKNADFRYDDLPERPVYLKDVNGNNVFDAGDSYVVYLEGPNEFVYDELNANYKHEIHNYSDYAYYFLSDQSDLKRVSSVVSVDTPNLVTNSYDFNLALEKDSINIMNSGRNFYWRHFAYYLSHSFNFSIPDLISDAPNSISMHYAIRSSVNSRFKIVMNGNTSYTPYVDAISGSYSGPYANEGYHTIYNELNGNNQFKIEYIPGTSTAEAWLDYITINARSRLNLVSNYLAFRDIDVVAEGNIAQYIISNANSSTQVWDITEPTETFEIKKQELIGNQLKFSAEADSLREFVAVNLNADFASPQFTGNELLGFIDNQNLHATSHVDYLIVSYPDFVPYANQLGALHEAKDGLSYYVTTPQEIYNEFSSGTPDVAAIRDFVKMFYDRAESDAQMPKYLLLFGDGSFDNKAPLGENGNFVPTFQAWNSLLPPVSYVSDDYFGLLDDNEGTVSGTEGLDIGIGRLPVKSISEAEAVMNKIVKYMSPESFGNWKNMIAFIGDDAEDSPIHMQQASEMGDTVMVHYPEFNVQKILLDAYTQISTVQGSRYPEVNRIIDERVNSGALLVNYTGHGNEKTLTHEAVVTLSQINSWDNQHKLPVFVTATCEFSPYDNYELVSAGEQIILNPNGGGIALFTTTRLVYSTSNEALNKEFYRQVFKFDEQNLPYALGEIIMHSKNNSTTTLNKRNFSLLGDPALRLAIPNYIVETDSINQIHVEEFSDTIRAGSIVTVSGHIEDRTGNLVSSYNGVLYPTIYDKVMEYTTLGNDQYPGMDFLEQKNILYSGKASIENGYFEFEFIIPVDIAYYFDMGKISYYAKSEDKDAHGFYNEFVIGGSANNTISDNFGPEIDLYMNNTDFIDGGLTDENPVLLAYVADESGINTVGNGIGHDITAVLNEDSFEAIILNDFYEADLDSYQSGVVTYPFSGLETGVHQLRFKVWDVFNNSSEAEISFIVANSSELVIEHVLNFPNPLIDQTCFTFNHNHTGELLDVKISIFDMNSRLIDTIEETVYSNGYTIDPICWNAQSGGGGRVSAGIYVYHVQVSSPNGDVVNKFEKMVVVK
jgi:hypothetical protein